jgi:hydrogenase nickel insertion protein HypA
VHEITLVKGMIYKALAMARQKGIDTIKRIEVAVGEINAIDRSEISECFDFLKRELPSIKHADLDVVIIKAQAECLECHTRFGAEFGGKCPECGAARVKMIAGDEIVVSNVMN